MNWTCQILLVLLASIVFCFVRGEAAVPDCTPDSIAFQIRLDKYEYLRGESVWLHLFLANLTTDTLQAVIPDCNSLNTVDVRVVNAAGERLPHSSGVRRPHRSCQQDVLLPSDTLLGIVDLGGLLDQRAPGGDSDAVGQLSGSFTVEAVYLDRMVSNPVHYTVVEPTGSEAEAFNLYRRTSRAVRLQRMAEIGPAAEALLQSFPRSAYAPQALDLLSLSYGGDPSGLRRKVDCYKRLVDVYPDHPSCQIAFTNILIRQTAEENRTFLRSVVAGKTGTWAARVAGNLLTRPWLERASRGGSQSGKK